MTNQGGVPITSGYQRFAGLYALAQDLLPAWRRYVARAAPCLPRRGPLLEIGCGPGALLRMLRGRSLVVGVDRSWAMLREAERRLGSESMSADGTVCLIQADALALPFRDGACAGAAMTFALGAIDDGAGALCEAERILSSGASLVLVEAVPPPDGNLAGRILLRLWTLFGTRLRDVAALAEDVGLRVTRDEAFGVLRTIRLVVAKKRGCHGKQGRGSAWHAGRGVGIETRETRHEPWRCNV